MAESVFNDLGEFSSDRIEDYSYEQLADSYDNLLMSIRDLQREYGDDDTPNGVKVMYEKIETKLDAIEDERESRRKKKSGPGTVSTQEQRQLENARRLNRFREWARTDAAERNRFREWAKMDDLERKQQESDISRLERFKEWAKENMAGLAGIAISIAGVITIIIVSARSVITKGAHATNKFAWNVYKSLRKAAKKLGPILGPVLNIIGSILLTAMKYGAKGLEWLAHNLWVLAVALTWIVYKKSIRRAPSRIRK